MNALNHTTSTTAHQKTDVQKNNHTIEPPAISLPAGGGAIKSIDEKFSVNPVNGTAGISLPLPISPARGCTPDLSLSYNSGAGNSIFGLGWQLNLASVKRKTGNRLPEYRDAEESDTFVFSGAEDLVPEFDRAADDTFLQDSNGDYIIKERNSPDNRFTIRFYKPRIETGFARIERWSAKDGSEIKWRVIGSTNITTLYGWSAASRIADPGDAQRIFQWLPEFIFDDKGNCCRYFYKKENAHGADLAALHNKNRLHEGAITYTNTYIDKVLYGNQTPYLQLGDAFPGEEDFMFETAFDYGTITASSPPHIIHDWEYRQDAFSDYTAGFEVRTSRLCKRVLLFHHFNEYKGLVRSLNISYNIAAFAFLQSATQVGYIKQMDGTYSSKALPALEFEYAQLAWNSEVKRVPGESLIHAPAGIDTAGYQFIDLYNEGLSGILTEQANGWYYKANRGVQEDGTLVFDQASLVSPKPSFTRLGSTMQLSDLDADGGKQLTSYHNATKGFFELDDDNVWQPFQNFQQFPNTDLRNGYTRMIDLTGDGKADLLITEDHVLTWYQSEGRKGFADARKTAMPWDEEEGPHMVFADATQSIFLADMSGDGLTDIVRIRNGEICYWPNLGYGHFGKKIAMDNAPAFDQPEAFNPAYIRLADIDGSGTADIIYLGKNKFSCWINCSGNRFDKTPFEINAFPEIHSAAAITIADLLGNGMACIVWSSPLSKDSAAAMQYIDLMNSRKPHILVKYSNNLGRELRFEYAPSTRFYLEDKLAGRPWITKLHFPVHCIVRTIVEDKITGHRFTSSYKYHHGYYDHEEREFRGFGMVEQTDADTFEHWKRSGASNITEETLHQEPVVTKQWFHTGAYNRQKKILAQYEKEYWYNEMMQHGFAVTHYEKQLEDARIITGKGIPVLYQLGDDECRQAFRACKSMVLRSELFAHDAIKNGSTPEAVKMQLTPYSVATHNCAIELLQPKGKNRHAVFTVKESEALSYSYERNTADPRISHTLNISLDEYGNVLESAAVVYPRNVIDPGLPAATNVSQQQLSIVYNRNRYTNDAIDAHSNRLRVTAETQVFELKGVSKTSDYYSVADFENILLDTRSDSALFHETDKPLNAGKAQRRLIEHGKTLFYQNDLMQSLPLYGLQTKGIGFETYRLAYTPELITGVYGTRVNEALLLEGRFIHLEDQNWWTRSGIIQYLKDNETAVQAQARFYMPVSYTDAYGAKTKVSYYGNYHLFVRETEDALQNRSTVLSFNFRTLSPDRTKDANDNIAEVLTDELGYVKATAILGKGLQADDLDGLTEITTQAEQDLIAQFIDPSVNTAGITNSEALMDTAAQLLQHATTRFVYDWNVYRNTGKPAVAASIMRETHYRDEQGNINPAAKLQLAFSYSSGTGKVVMQKAQAEPGIAKRVTITGNSVVVEEVDTAPLLRWIGNGKVIVNNKGNAVKQYEPYFSISNQYEQEKELVETGVTPVFYYDALHRQVRTDMPDGTFLKVEFDNWKQLNWDANDTVLQSNWYKRRTDSSHPDYINDVKEQEAAQQSAAHAGTPGQQHLDALGRPILAVQHNRHPATGADEFYYVTTVLDIEGNLRKVIDARGNTVVTHKYNMLGNKVYQNGMDSGQRWLLSNILGHPLRTWDERNHEFQYEYDILHRPVQSKITGGDGSMPLNHVFERVVYGESQPDAPLRNLRGRVMQHYDTAGLSDVSEGYDFKAQPRSTKRKLFSKYKEVTNWINENLVNDLEPMEFITIMQTDAIGRVSRQVAPDGAVILPVYNEAGLLNAATIQLTNPAETVICIKDVDYNERRQRNKIIYGNDVVTNFYYDPETFLLRRLESKRKNNDPLQHWQYTFDATGNITHIEDSNIPPDFFGNNKTTGISKFTYDALYRLVGASGRENNAAHQFAACDNWNDNAFMHYLNAGDPFTARTYVEKYAYDAVGNILELQHIANGGSFTRTYAYKTTNNRLTGTSVGNNEYTNYTHHDTHGFLTQLPHLEKIGWNFKEQVAFTSRQHCTADNIPVTTYYQYDAQGRRIRKITENQAGQDQTPAKKEERIYLNGYELYKKHSGPHAGLERVTISMMNEGHRFVMIETRNETDDGTQRRLMRYQLNNHIQSASMELDAFAQVISYEEYHPFGTTAYQANSNVIKSASKRYRFTGMERDEETGLAYHHSRYYLPWLGRWLSADPIGIGGGLNVYAYCKNNPIASIDTTGTVDGPAGGGGTPPSFPWSLPAGLFHIEDSLPPNPDANKFVLGLGRAETGYMRLAATNTGLTALNIQDTYNISRGNGMRFPASMGWELAMERNNGSLAPMFSGIMVQEALEGHQVGTVHLNMDGVDLTPGIASGMPGLSPDDFHSSSEARQVIAHLASTNAGERKVDIVIAHQGGITTIARNENRVAGAPLPPELAERMPNINNVPHPPPAPAAGTPPTPSPTATAPAAPAAAAPAPVAAPPPAAGGVRGFIGNTVKNVGSQVVPGAAEAVMATEVLEVTASGYGFARLGAAAASGAKSPGPGIVGGAVGAVTGVLAEGVAKSYGASDKAATGIGLGSAVLTGAGVAAGIALTVALVATAPVSLTVIGGAALVGGLTAGFGYLTSKMY